MLSHKKYGSPVCHVHSSLLTTELLQEMEVEEDKSIDEYGFVHDGERQRDGQDEVEYLEIQQQWIALLHTQHDKLATSSSLEHFEQEIDVERSPVLDKLIGLGITDKLRPFFWPRLCGALQLKASSEWTYAQILDLTTSINVLSDEKVVQIMAHNVCFGHANSIACERLKTIMAIVEWYKKIDPTLAAIHDHLQLDVIAAHLLLMCNEQCTLWLLLRIAKTVNIVEVIELIEAVLAKVSASVAVLLAEHDIHLATVAKQWFGALFATTINDAGLLYKLWDLLFYEGPVLLIEIIVGLVITNTRTLEACCDSSSLFNTLSNLPSKVLTSLESVTSCWRMGKNIVNAIQLPSHVFYNHNNSSQQLVKQLKVKNVKQTSLVMNLHEAIVALANHFQAYECKASFKLEPDYNGMDGAMSKSVVIMVNICTHFLVRPTDGAHAPQLLHNRMRLYKQRAKALIDFAASERDELSFAQNDLITIIKQKDEHCWVGELDGRIGWFPAKFVEKVNERDGEYSTAGDDGAVPFINDLVRGQLCSALRAILLYDLKQSYFVHSHPWTIIETVCEQHSSSHLASIVSKIVLNKTFCLEEMARILTPDELLFRTIAYVKHTHSNAPLDVRLRSFICLGLNQYVLHDWWQTIATSCPAIIERHYGQASYLTTPAWKLVKAELKLLEQFPFYLNPLAELESGKLGEAQAQASKSTISKESVCDMLVKYHLFSWDM